MHEGKDEFFDKLLATFRIEAEEHVKAISTGLLELEKPSNRETQMKIVERIYREAHSLKGAARAVNAQDIEKVSTCLESVFSSLKRREIQPSSGLFDLLHQAGDRLRTLLSTLGKEKSQNEENSVVQLIQTLENILKGVPAPGTQQENNNTNQEVLSPPKLETQIPPVEPKPVLADTIRISAEKLDSLLLEVEELLSAKLAASHQAMELREISAAFNSWEKQWARIGTEVRTLRRSLEENGRGNEPLAAFLDWNHTFVNSLQSRSKQVSSAAERDHQSLTLMVDNLLADVRKALLLPMSSLLEIFPKFARDLSRDRGKEVNLVIKGEDIEVDRRILEEMKDPLIHLVRNCIDHGIEKPKDRARKEKPRRGTLTVAVTQKYGDKIELLVADDGEGIKAEKVRTIALQSGLLSREEADTLQDKELLEFVFHSGFSTSPLVTDISGRGLGLAIVREKVENLGGSLQLDTHPDAGTTFRIILPMTLATFRGLLVTVNGHPLIVPTLALQRVVRSKSEEIKTVENRETIQLDGQTVALLRLEDVLGIPRRNRATELQDSICAIVLGSADKRIAFSVDQILNEQEVTVRSFGKQLVRVRNMAGAGILGTGKAVPILNAMDLLESAARGAGTVERKTSPRSLQDQRERKKFILVVEDSATARMLLKNILLAAGYEVRTAVDGIDAITALRSQEEVDVVVSDVDMPRMNGFDLTAKIRSDKQLSELPVILVTALESREDRERGIDVGANAYIVKSSFDQSNLLEVIRRFV